MVLAALTGVMFMQGKGTPKLGLDLAGGTTVTLTAKTENGKNPPSSQMDQAVKIMTQRVNGLGVSDAEVAKQGGNNIVVNLPGQGQGKAAETIGSTAKLQFRQVFAEASGLPQKAPATTPSPTPTGSGKPTGKATIPGTGASPSGTPSSTAKPTDSSTPRGRALSKALTAPTPSGSPSAKPTGSTTPKPSGTPTPQTPVAPDGNDFAGVDDKAAIAEFEKAVCSPGGGPTLNGSDDVNRKWVVSCDDKSEKGRVTKYLLGPVRVVGEDVKSANAMPPDTSQGQSSWSVNIGFNGRGGNQFAQVTTEAYKAYQANPSSPQAQVAIVLDGKVVSAPSINQGAITGGSARIDGPADSFNQTYADDLANKLKYGALPLKFTPSSTDEVSSTLGNDQLRGGLIAGGIGLALVVFYCMLYYQGLGLVAVGSLAIASWTTYVSVVILGENMGFRLSLAHIIGLIVSIGITADSFIVYFERIRDELRQGRALRPSVEVAWKRARRTILVADAVTFIAAVVLYFLAVGGVAGFAFAMGLTTLIDVVVVFFFTKPLMSVLSRTEFFGRGHKFSGLDAARLRRSAQSRSAGTARPTNQEA
ncbi:protein translocase subunit SecD [Actinomadura rupiterrae]|uniref:protein translocase subunit SecD n=1 Tax=Actinomadura rupiterrae TaxID=559627 RepID=UPI0027E23A60|nr:protein translocase subunit SecD [Actinomadura rupiterrae]MCP2340860.1 preprotein translocase subunit SecD [Actinomadura rupiterrae]